MDLALAVFAGQFTAFVASQDSIIGTTKKRVASGVSAVASTFLRGSIFCGAFVVSCDLWAMQELMDGREID